MTSSKITDTFVEYDDDGKLLCLLMARPILNKWDIQLNSMLYHAPKYVKEFLPCWYSHLTVVANDLPLSKMYELYAECASTGINHYEGLGYQSFLYSNPSKYHKVLFPKLMKMSTELAGYHPIKLHEIPAGTDVSQHGSFVNNLLHGVIPEQDITISIMVKGGRPDV